MKKLLLTLMCVLATVSASQATTYQLAKKLEVGKEYVILSSAALSDGKVHGLNETTFAVGPYSTVAIDGANALAELVETDVELTSVKIITGGVSGCVLLGVKSGDEYINYNATTSTNFLALQTSKTSGYANMDITIEASGATKILCKSATFNKAIIFDNSALTLHPLRNATGVFPAFYEKLEVSEDQVFLALSPSTLGLNTNPDQATSEVTLTATKGGKVDNSILDMVTYSFKDAKGNVFTLADDNKVATYDPATKLLTAVGAGNITLVATYDNTAETPGDVWQEANLWDKANPTYDYHEYDGDYTDDFSNEKLYVKLDEATASARDAHFEIATGLKLTVGQKYKFEYDITSSDNLKPQIDLTYFDNDLDDVVSVGDDSEENLDLEANVTKHVSSVFTCTTPDTGYANGLLVVLNIGGNQAGTEVTISNISLVEAEKPVTAESAITVTMSRAQLFNEKSFSQLPVGSSVNMPDGGYFRILDITDNLNWVDINPEYYTLTYSAIAANSDEESDVISVTESGVVTGKNVGKARVKVTFTSKYFSCANSVLYYPVTVVEGDGKYSVTFNAVQGEARVCKEQNGALTTVWNVNSLYNNGTKWAKAEVDETYYLLPGNGYEFTEVLNSAGLPVELEYSELVMSADGKQIGYITFNFDDFSPVYTFRAKSSSVTDDQDITFKFGGEKKNVDTETATDATLTDDNGVVFFATSKTFTEPAGAIQLSFPGYTPAGYSADGEYLFLGYDLKFPDRIWAEGSTNMQVGFTNNKNDGSVIKKVVFDYAEGSATLTPNIGYMSADGTVWTAEEQTEPEPVVAPNLWDNAKLSLEVADGGQLDFSETTKITFDGIPAKGKEPNMWDSFFVLHASNIKLEAGKRYKFAFNLESTGTLDAATICLHYYETGDSGSEGEIVNLNPTLNANESGEFYGISNVIDADIATKPYLLLEGIFGGNSAETDLTISNISLTEVAATPAAAPALNTVAATATPITDVTFTPKDGNVKLANISVVYDGPELPTGIETVEASAEDVEAVYYNLQGVRVENPANGIYIRVQGNKVDKILVK